MADDHPDDGDASRRVRAGRQKRTISRRSGLLLRQSFPDLIPLLHPTLNPDLDLATLTAGSGRKLWWKCPRGSDHEWPAKVGNLTRWEFRCPFCIGQRVSADTNALATLYPQVASQWHPQLNGVLTPDDVVYGSNRNVWWWCGAGSDHVWQAQIYLRTVEQTGCPYCTNKKVSRTNALSVVYPGVAAQWHPDRNGSLTPDDVVFGSGRMAWWQCEKAPDHEWKVRVVQRTTMGTGCPCCANQKISYTNALDALFPDVAAVFVKSN